MPSVAELAKLFERGVRTSASTYEKAAPPRIDIPADGANSALSPKRGSPLSSGSKALPGSSTASYPVHGVSLAHLRALLDDAPHMKHWDVYQFCEEFVKPLTAEWRCSYADYLARSPATQAHTQPQADLFVSYAWATSLAQLVGALDEQAGFVWIDVLVLNQHVRSEPPSPAGLRAVLERVLRSIGGLCVVVTPWETPAIHGRLWCVFEQCLAAAGQIKVRVVMPKEEKEGLIRAMKWGLGEEFFTDLVASVDVRNAKATDAADQDSLCKLLTDVGAPAANEHTLATVRQWLLDVARECAVEDGTKEAANVWTAMGTLHQISVRASARTDRAHAAGGNTGRLGGRGAVV
jgi:hypothetical protein